MARTTAHILVTLLRDPTRRLGNVYYEDARPDKLDQYESHPRLGNTRTALKGLGVDAAFTTGESKEVPWWGAVFEESQNRRIGRGH